MEEISVALEDAISSSGREETADDVSERETRGEDSRAEILEEIEEDIEEDEEDFDEERTSSSRLLHPIRDRDRHKATKTVRNFLYIVAAPLK